MRGFGLHSKLIIASQRSWWPWLLCFALCNGGYRGIQAQVSEPAAQTTEDKIQQITVSVHAIQSQMEANQKQLFELQHQLEELQQQVLSERGVLKEHVPQEQEPIDSSQATAGPAKASPSTDDLREGEAVNQAQISTLDQAKVESGSKHPLKLSGLILFNGFINTRAVDIASSPAYALPGPGSTGGSLRQTILGFDARGPHLLGASSHADLHVDFFADSSFSGYASGGLLRLRTAHAELRWPNSATFFSLDRTIIAPNTPTSLLAVGQPELAWSGNLWSWNPQLGATHVFARPGNSHIEVKAALIDPQDPKLPAASTSTTLTRSEKSRWPGSEAHVAYTSERAGTRTTLGIGGYFSPHRTSDEINFNSWAGALDLTLALRKHLELTVNTYRGQGLGGLGGGGYVDYVYRYHGSVELTRALEDIGGWAQLKAKASSRTEINAGYGLDNPFAKEIQESIVRTGPDSYNGLTRNRTVFSNIIFSPSAYLLFSLEYRRNWSSYASGNTYWNDAIGLGAGYRF